jgi:hypothetical protein
MKVIRAINYIVLIAPLLLVLIGTADDAFLIFAALSTMVTGAAQVIMALVMLFSKPKNPLLYSYFAITILFFAIWGFTGSYDMYIFATPAMLALFFTYIIYAQIKDEKAAATSTTLQE